MQEKIVTRLLIATLSCRLLFGNFSARCQVLSCDPAQIGQSHQVVFKVNTSCNIDIPRIEALDDFLTCPDYTISEKNKQKYNVTLFKAADELTLTLHIYNVSTMDTDSALWFQLYDNINTTKKNCILSVYLKSKELNCSTNIKKDAITVECFSSRMYPNGDCVFDTNLKIGTYDTNVTTINDTTQMKHVYFKKHCSLSIPVASLTPREINVNVTVYPEVKGDTTDSITYGTKTSNVVNVEMPSVIVRNCPSTVKEGINVTCYCERSDSSDVDVVIYWFDNVTLNIVSEGNVSFIGNRDLKALYYCQSVNIFGWKSEPVFYQPKIAYKMVRNRESNRNVGYITAEAMKEAAQHVFEEGKSLWTDGKDTNIKFSNLRRYVEKATQGHCNLD